MDWLTSDAVALPPAIELHAFSVQAGSSPTMRKGSVLIHLR
jgi:hypothetical protein